MPNISFSRYTVWQKCDDSCHSCQPPATTSYAYERTNKHDEWKKSTENRSGLQLDNGNCSFALAELSASSGPVEATSGPDGNKPAVTVNPLKPPVQGSIPVAFLVSDGAVIIDFCGPWEVFQDVNIPGRSNAPFRLYTVAETTAPIRASGGMRIVPDYTLTNAPAPKVIVIPAQSEPSAAVLEWIRKSTKNTDVTMSVCTGAFVLAKTGLLSGKAATTFHAAFRPFAIQFPDIHLKREPGSSRIAISLRRADFPPALISHSAWLNAITVARSPRRPPTTWSTRDKAG